MEKALLPVAATKVSSHESVLPPGAILQDRYRIVRQLGRGGMGAVYEAVDQRLDATVALKETLSAGDRLRRQFEQEARLLAQLHHPALPRVSDYFTEGDRAFLVMQFISGSDLAEIIAKQPGPFPRQQVIAWADQLLDALVYLHTRNRQIIHRDIKPHNLKLTLTGQIALLDFGLAKAQARDLSATSSRSIFGYTRRYSPLEQIQDQGTTPQSDIYALGATLYHLLTGIKPPDALARAAALVNSKPDPLKPANEIYPAVGPELGTILSRAMAQNPEDRYPTAYEFREELRQIGRRKPETEKASTHLITATPTSDSTVNTTVVRKRASAIDPFDSYSILKPDEMAWLIPKPSRRPGMVVAVLVIFFVAGFGAFYAFGRWIDTPTSVLGYAKTASGRNEGGTPAVHTSKSEKSRVGAPAITTIPAASAAGAAQKNEKPRRINVRIDRNHPRTPMIVVPRLAIPQD